MPRSIRSAMELLTASALVLTASWASAGQLLPNPALGNPTTAGPINHIVVSLLPNPATYQSYCPWLLPAAMTASQPYNQAESLSEWNFNYAPVGTFNGTFSVTTFAASITGRSGGANFAITYTPGQGDPTGTSLRWIQVIDTNMPSPRGATYSVAGTGLNGIPQGTTAYLDNAGPGGNIFQPGAPIDPYYGWLSVPEGDNYIYQSTLANASGFSDGASLPLVPGLF